MSTIFTKIIAGEIPSFRIYENEKVIAFLDIFPQTKGHTLIVPKVEIDHFSDLPDEYLEAIFLTAKKLSPVLQKVTNCARVCAKFEGFEIAHCHFHLLPVMDAEGVNFWPTERASDADLLDLQQKIIAELS